MSSAILLKGRPLLRRESHGKILLWVAFALDHEELVRRCPLEPQAIRFQVAKSTRRDRDQITAMYVEYY